jgi:hypothetical protein
MKNAVLQLILNLGLKNFAKLAEGPLEKVPHIQTVARAYEAGEPLEVIIALWLQATESVSDDDIAGKVAEVIEFINVEIPKILATFSTEPAKVVIARLLGDLKIPDLDNDSTNNFRIVDVLNATLAELAD